MDKGVLPSQRLREAISNEWMVAGDWRIPAEAVQPASVDLRLGGHAWALRCSFLPDSDSTVEEKVESLAFERIDLRDGATLERDRPYLVPLVELCPAPWTDPAVVTRTRTLMTNAGQVPATVNKEMDGFALNRLQGALLAEAFRLIADDVISPADIDALVKHGLGLRWSFMGPLETIDLNAPGGLRDYCERYGPLYWQLQRQMTPREWSTALIDRLHGARRAELPANMHGVRQEWRDRRLMALLAHKMTQPE